MIVGQVLGFIDVLLFAEQKATVTHSLQIKEAGDINNMSQGTGTGVVMIACQKGILLCNISSEG